jgi:predicted transcriptional regulator of viral defense system
MLSKEISKLATQGQSCFSFKELRQRIGSSPAALRSALHRLSKKGEIAMPLRGFYVIVPPEYRALGCRPAEEFIPDLMAHVNEPYYAGLLTAADYYGAAHHRPQVFQVVVAKARRPIRCGRVRVDFVVRKNIHDIPTQSMNTPTGILKLSTPEATALDLVGYAKHCVGLDNVATVLAELFEKLKADKIAEVAKLSPIAWSQRLGYLLDTVEATDVSEPLARYVEQEKPVRTPLLAAASIKGAKTNCRWKLFVNAAVEVEA